VSARTCLTRSLALLGTLSLLAASGCAQGGTSPTATTPPGDLPSTGWVAADRDDLADGGILRLAVDALPATYQVYSASSLSADDVMIARLYLPSFVRLTEDGGWTADPDYATQVTLRSTDPQVVQVRINPDAVWSDGTPITVEDVAATWQALSGADPAYAVGSTTVWRDVEAVTAGEDERDVLIRFARVNADWPTALGLFYPRWALDTPDRFEAAWAHGPMAADGAAYVSGGPFVVSSIDDDAKVLTLQRNPSWWGDTPKLGTVVLTAVSRSGLAQAFANRELDAVDLYSDTDAYRIAQSRDDALILRSQGSRFRNLTLNGLSPHLSDVRVRQALALSLDREVLARAVLDGVGSQVQTQGNMFFVAGQQGYVDHVTPLLDGGVERARELLTEAGYDVSGPVATKDGEPLTVRFVIPSGIRASSSVAQLVAQQAGRAGFDVTIEAVPAETFFGSYVNTEARAFDVAYFSWEGEAFPIAGREAFFYPADSPWNLPGVTEQSLGSMWQRANAELDPEARVHLANEIDERLVGMFTVIPLFSEPTVWGATSTLRNYGPAQLETVRWQDVGFTR